MVPSDESGDDDLLEELPPQRPRDAKIDQAKAALMANLFDKRSEEVFYGRQVEVLFEKEFFHWITNRALGELVAEREILSAVLPLKGEVVIRVFWSKRNRYWKRQAEEIRRIVLKFSTQEFGRALGRQAETLFDAALPVGGFMPRARNVRAYNGLEWTKTGHDLDRVFERDGRPYGVEIKNRLDYIEAEELGVKLAMCAHLKLTPLFIMRMAPKSYIARIVGAGGYALIVGWQLYPFGREALAKEVKERLGLPVDCPRAISEGTIGRLSSWHERAIRA